jgi:hypothetical protein
LVGGKSDEKQGGVGGRSFGHREFYSERRERELAAGPHVGVDDRRRGGPAAAVASGQVLMSNIPGPLTGGDAAGLNRPGPL